MHRLVEEELLDLAGCVPERFGQARSGPKKKDGYSSHGPFIADLTMVIFPVRDKFVFHLNKTSFTSSKTIVILHL